MAGSDDATLTKIAIFGITISLFCTLGVSVMLVQTGDYDYDDIQAYKNDLISFSGESMINDNPWIMTHVYTPWISGDPVQVDDDGWLYGQEITNYTYLNQSAHIKLDVGHKSSTPLTYSTEVAPYTEQTGDQWWANIPVIGQLGKWIGFDPYTYETKQADSWNFTGYRYVFDATLPFAVNDNTPSTADGSLSLVWYNYNGTEGLSGGLDIYGGDVLIAHYTASDIVADYNTESGYATVYDFDFNGAHLNLSILFDQNVIDGGTPLMQAWSQGDWEMAISSKSVGNFLDLEDSVAYDTSVAGMLDTFVKIFTFNVPDLDNEWAAMILWLLCGLPMTIALLCVTMRVISAIGSVIPG